MIARRVKPGVMEIVNQPGAGEIESFTLLDITCKDAIQLIFASNDFKKKDNRIIINYKDGDLVYSMFKAIATKHQKENPDFMDVSKKVFVSNLDIPGTSLLLKNPSSQTISIAKRTTRNSNECSINRIFISNETREKFFRDAKNSNHYRLFKKFAIDVSDFDSYFYWSNFMKDAYMDILNKYSN